MLLLAESCPDGGSHSEDHVADVLERRVGPVRFRNLLRPRHGTPARTASTARIDVDLVLWRFRERLDERGERELATVVVDGDRLTLIGVLELVLDDRPRTTNVRPDPVLGELLGRSLLERHRPRRGLGVEPRFA